MRKRKQTIPMEMKTHAPVLDVEIRLKSTHDFSRVIGEKSRILKSSKLVE
jgi:hypothetical protein